MLMVIAQAVETVLLVSGIVMLVRCAFQYAARTDNWHQVNVVLFRVRSLSNDELKWWYAAMISLSLGLSIKVLTLFLAY